MCPLSLTVSSVKNIMTLMRFIPIFWISLRAWNHENEVPKRNNLHPCLEEVLWHPFHNFILITPFRGREIVENTCQHITRIRQQFEEWDLTQTLCQNPCSIDIRSLYAAVPPFSHINGKIFKFCADAKKMEKKKVMWEGLMTVVSSRSVCSCKIWCSKMWFSSTYCRC